MNATDLQYQSPESLQHRLEHGQESPYVIYRAGRIDGWRRGLTAGIAYGIAYGIMGCVAVAGVLVCWQSCESSAHADPDPTIVVEPIGDGWYSDGVYFYTQVKGEWYISEVVGDLAGAAPLGRGKRVRVHGAG